MGVNLDLKPVRRWRIKVLTNLGHG